MQTELSFMKAVILAGGLGTRISEETHIRPKPMVEIGGKPLLWHILKLYSHHGINDFIICCGYKGYVIKEYFANYFLHNSDVTIHMSDGRMDVHRQNAEPWKITLVDTGESTDTGGRLLRVAPYLNNSPFCFTYGDGLANVDLTALVAFHEAEGKDATLTAVQPPGRYGSLDLPIGSINVNGFIEKPQGDGGWINGGFFVLTTQVLKSISGDGCSWEKDVLPQLAANKQLVAYRHHGFWQAMDTLRERNILEGLWSEGRAPWKQWA